ncbi:MAG: Asp-tRNA(Asn)/Glu-tRNA(Gln) amidotransferase subunit GatC [Bacillota bacterium]|nr:Asp-tRNA(Asn)/Glu-tRNA(Gln) amidotransferase subunit GatC [Clostridia bacterium]
MAVTIKDVEKTAFLARIDLSEEEKNKFTEEIKIILDHVENFVDLNTENIPPTINILPLYNVMRDDITRPSLDKNAVFQNTSHEEDGMFKVPKIL